MLTVNVRRKRLAPTVPAAKFRLIAKHARVLVRSIVAHAMALVEQTAQILIVMVIVVIALLIIAIAAVAVVNAQAKWTVTQVVAPAAKSSAPLLAAAAAKFRLIVPSAVVMA
jgi:hypothetical protein